VADLFIKEVRMPNRRYNALRLLSLMFKILGVIAALGTILSVIGALFTGISLLGSFGRDFAVPGMMGFVGSLIATVVSLIAGGLTALGLYATGELFEVLLAIESNTRALAQASMHQHVPGVPYPASPPYAAPPPYSGPPPY